MELSESELEQTVLSFAEEWDSPLAWIPAKTSGSTGAPKEIRLLKKDMLASAAATNRFFGITYDSVLVCPLSLNYIAAKMMFVRARLANCKSVFLKPSSDPLSHYTCTHDISLLAIVPSQVEGLLSSGLADKVKQVIIGGGPISLSRENLLMDKGINAWATYGMTETCSHVALRKVAERDYFTALPGFRFKLNPQGCLCIHSETMSFGEIVTNDCAELISDTEFRIIGRVDNVINSGGIKIHPEDIETKISHLLAGYEFYISSAPSDKWGEECILIVEGKVDDIFAEHIIDECRKLLPPYHAPKRVIWQTELQRTDSGKIIRRKLK